jgi:hypothetical protein
VHLQTHMNKRNSFDVSQHVFIYSVWVANENALIFNLSPYFHTCTTTYAGAEDFFYFLSQTLNELETKLHSNEFHSAHTSFFYFRILN